MKKQLLLSGALLLSIGAFSQKQTHLFQGAKVVEDKHFLNSLSKANLEFNASTTSNRSIGPVKEEVITPNSSSSNSSSAPILNNVWYRISGSGNVYGFLVSASKPLNYQRILGAVSFIQRKSATYVVSPAGDGNVGSIVAYWGKNDANTNNLSSWDSTLIYADATNGGRYPSGGIWNTSPGNQNLNNAVAVGSGPVTTGSGWVGSWYASKSLSLTPKNAAGPDEQFFANASPFNSATSPSMTKHDFPRYGFNVCDNGVFVAGQKMADINGTTNAAQAYRGASISKGTFNSGVMVWTQDSIIPAALTRTDGTKIVGEPYLKFTPTGTLGYCMFIGVRQGAAVGSSNRGNQPIVYKTTNSGASWVLVNNINFDAVTPQITQIKNTMRTVGGVSPAVEAPWFWGEGIDMTIDAAGRLHIIATQIGHASSHQDSMNYLSTYNATENYHWPHVNTARPLIVDYYGDGTGNWNTLIIDSLDTEGPSSTSGEGGFVVNPWADPTPNNSVSSDSRIQITRSYDGEFLAYSWAETDTLITTSSAKWNEFPNIKVRGFRSCDGSLSTEPGGFNVTGQSGVLAAVKDKAYFHYMSGEMKAGASSATSATFAIPFSVSSNPLTEGINPVSNYFAMTHVGFTFPSGACGATITTGVASAKTDASESSLFPNPTENNFNVRLNLSTANDIAVSVFNALGQKVSETKVNGTIGENNVSMNMDNATAGVYFVKIKVGKSESTKKLVVQ